jgi:4-amino-4-deoxy-L-arabinose transferase-like glycosyltransferase
MGAVSQQLVVRTVERRLATGPVVAAALTTGVLLALAGRYGPHRDELYFMAAGHHPQWGYPDQPPLTPLIAAAADTLAPGSLLALRAFSAVIAGLVVLLTADLARALGGDRRAQLLAAVATGTGAGVLAIGHLLSTATPDLLAWTVVVRLVVATLQHDRPRLWLAVGLALGVGLENKHLVGFLAAGLVVGIALTPRVRHHLRSPWAWAGAAVAVALWLPNVAWQAQHGWPQLELAGDIRDEYRTPGGTAQLIGFQALMLNPLGAVLAVAGARAAWRRPDWAFFRPVPIAYGVLLVAFAVTGGKNYYLLGLLPPLAAAGSVAAAERRPGSRLRTTTALVAVTALFPVPALLPVLPAATLDASFYPALNEDGLETIGWPSVVATVRGVLATLPAADRRTAVVVTQNYGQAGALLWYGVDAPVASGHNGFGDWGPPTSTGPVVYVGYEAPAADQLSGCRPAASLSTGVDNEENSNAVWVCDGPAGSWQRAWPRIRHLSA